MEGRKVALEAGQPKGPPAVLICPGLSSLQKANLDSLARKAMVSEECWLKVISEVTRDCASGTCLLSEAGLLHHAENIFLSLQPKSTLEERALARLLNLKKVQDFVTSFRKEHPEWKSWVPQLVEMWDEKKARRLSYKAKGAGPTGRAGLEAQNKLCLDCQPLDSPSSFWMLPSLCLVQGGHNGQVLPLENAASSALATASFYSVTDCYRKAFPKIFDNASYRAPQPPEGAQKACVEKQFR